MRRNVLATASALAAVLATFAPRAASAFTIESQLTTGCHEAMTEDALRAVRAEFPTAAPLPNSGDDDAAIADAPFHVPEDFVDIGGATLLFGVRDNDLKGRGSASIDQLATVHGDPDAQKEHCLRSPSETEPGGSASAVSDCRDYIRSTFAAALDGLDANGNPDPADRVALPITLSLRGKYDLPVPVFYLRMGQAIHALQDSFSHDFRTHDGRAITVSLNWVAYAEGHLVESVDGPAHRSEMDRCDDPDELRAERHRLAIEASVKLLRAALDPSLSRDQKLRAADAVLDAYVVYQPGCTWDNHWCDAPENQYQNPSACGCRTAGKGNSNSMAAILFGIALAGASLRRRLRSASAAAFVVSSAAIASAAEPPASTPPKVEPQPAPQPGAPPIGAPPANAISSNPVAQEGHEEHGGEFFFHAAGAASYDRPALAAILGGKVTLSTGWMLGLDAEYNPWISTDTKKIRDGAANAYASIIRRYQMRYEPVNLRTRLSVGASMLLIDLAGAPKGSVGPFVGVSFLGVEWKLAKGVYLIVDPLSIELPVPHMTGAPFGYPQYRFTLGIELGGLSGIVSRYRARARGNGRGRVGGTSIALSESESHGGNRHEEGPHDAAERRRGQPLGRAPLQRSDREVREGRQGREGGARGGASGGRPRGRGAAQGGGGGEAPRGREGRGVTAV